MRCGPWQRNTPASTSSTLTPTPGDGAARYPARRGRAGRGEHGLSAALFSGRGFALHYVLKEPIPVDSEEAISFAALYQCAFDKLERLLENGASEAGTDVDRVVHGISRMGRVAGTLNTKA